jgi:hypothetical protein
MEKDGSVIAAAGVRGEGSARGGRPVRSCTGQCYCFCQITIVIRNFLLPPGPSTSMRSSTNEPILT